MLNIAQKILIASYGLETHTEDQVAEIMDNYRKRRNPDNLNSHFGDGLFSFLLIELSDAEDCDSVGVAISRLDRAISEVERVRTTLAAIDMQPDALGRVFPDATALQLSELTCELSEFAS